MKLKCTLTLLLTFVLSLYGYAQNATINSSITGTVKDGQNNGIPGATVTATHEAQGYIHTTYTTDDGSFYLQYVPIRGPYRVDVSGIGFETKAVHGIYLSEFEPYNINVILSPVQVPNTQAPPPQNTLGPKLLDILLTLLHLLIIGFNLTGWIWQATRKWHLACIILTACSWLILGIWFGIGYCPVTDWQWQVKEQLGETNLPNSFITYYAEKISGRDISDSFINDVTMYVFIAVAALSVYVNFFRKRNLLSPLD